MVSSDWMFQVSGTKSAGGVYTWQTQSYLSTFKVGNLSALSADLGTVTAGTIQSGNLSNGVFITPSAISIYEGGALRVKIGNL